MTFVLLVRLKFKKISFLWRNFRFRARRNNFPKYTKIAYSISFTLFPFTWRKTLTRVQIQLDTLHSPTWKVSKKIMDVNYLEILLISLAFSHYIRCFSPSLEGCEFPVWNQAETSRNWPKVAALTWTMNLHVTFFKK